MSNDEITRLRTALDAATSYIFALEGQKETVVARARRSYEAALAALDQLDVSPTMGRCPDCGNPDRYCDCPDRTPGIGGDE